MASLSKTIRINCNGELPRDCFAKLSSVDSSNSSEGPYPKSGCRSSSVVTTSMSVLVNGGGAFVHRQAWVGRSGKEESKHSEVYIREEGGTEYKLKMASRLAM